jgi:hypothetical protein
MSYTSIAVLCSLILLLGMIIAFETGRRIGIRWLAEEQAANGLLDGAVFGLLGLLLAFTFNGAASRFEHRKDLVIQEANVIGTAYLRLDLLPIEAQPELRSLFRQYLDARLDIYRELDNPAAFETPLARVNALQAQTWTMAVKACQSSGSVPATTLLLTAINEMIDIATLNTATMRFMHPPIVIYVMLFIFALLSLALAGYLMAGTRKRHWAHAIAFSTMTALTVYVILDIEYPRIGLIRVDAVNQVLVSVRKSMD